MDSMIQPLMIFAESPAGDIVHIDQVSNGIHCQCVCPSCRGKLVAKNGGAERAHHFAHGSGSECKSGPESALHLAAKYIVSLGNQIALPPTSYDKSLHESIHCFDYVELEKTIRDDVDANRVIVDCYTCGPAGTLAVEIAVCNPVDDSKAILLENLQLPTIEIDLSHYLGKWLTWDQLVNAVIYDQHIRHWVFRTDLGSSISNSDEPISVDGSGCMEKRNEWKFAVGNTLIYVKRLPFGNFKVFHRYDEAARSIVEPICRSRGFWNKKYRNWIVYDRFRRELIELLSRRATFLPDQ